MLLRIAHHVEHPVTKKEQFPNQPTGLTLTQLE